MYIVGIELKSNSKFNSLLSSILIGIFDDEALAKNALKFAEDCCPNEYVFIRNVEINKDYFKEKAKELVK